MARRRVDALTAADNADPDHPGDPRVTSRQYFGTDGIRGTVGQPPITPDFVLHLGHAVGRVLKASEAGRRC